jgi:hypothetical protein
VTVGRLSTKGAEPSQNWYLSYVETNETNQMTRYDVRCGQAPWENTTTDLDSAIDLAYHLSEDYQCDVNIHYNHTGTIYTTVSNY